MLSTSAESLACPRILQLRQTTLFVTRNIPTPLRSNIRKLFPRNSLSNSRILSYSRVVSNRRSEKRIWRLSMNFPSFFLCLGFKVPIGKLFISPSDKSTYTGGAHFVEELQREEQNAKPMFRTWILPFGFSSFPLYNLRVCPFVHSR